jgi:hypothetical protein
MKPDLYTKAVLTVIAFMLVMIGCHQYISPMTVVQAEGPFAGVQFSTAGAGYRFFDTRTGDLWELDTRFGSNGDPAGWEWLHRGRVTRLGQPLSK